MAQQSDSQAHTGVTMFEVVVPFDRVNFLNKDTDSYLIAAAGIEIPLLLENRPGPPNLVG
jgi:hypothetical protein